MQIGIDGSRAFIKKRTGIEEYSYQVIKNLMDKLSDHQVILYIRENQDVQLNLPRNWKIKKIKPARLWTQLGLSLEILFHPVDVLFIPAHTVPFIHPKNTVVVVHGLEYEFCPEAYSWFEKFYMSLSIRKSCHWARKIISVSQNTKKDLIELYKIKREKIDVVYEGYEKQLTANNSPQTMEIQKPFFLFIGRIEERKNITNIVKAFEILKDEYKIPHKLFLAGRPGHGYKKIESELCKLKSKKDIIELGFVSEQEKWNLLREAQVFIFPTSYEGFGIPILEAQSVGCPVVASNNSSIAEVMGDSNFLIDPKNPEDIARAIYDIISKESQKNAIIEQGLKNVKRFSWEKCASEIVQILVTKN